MTFIHLNVIAENQSLFRFCIVHSFMCLHVTEKLKIQLCESMSRTLQVKDEILRLVRFYIYAFNIWQPEIAAIIL